MTKKTVETKKTVDAPKSGEHQKPPVALVLELEYMLFPGRQLMFEAFGGVLKNHQIALNQSAFSRYGLPRAIEKALQGLLPALGKKGLAAEGIADKIKQQFESSLNESANVPRPELAALLQKAAENNVKIGLLSFLPQEDADRLMARLSLNPPACLHVMNKKADDLPTPDSWLSLLKTMAVVPRCAIALVDNALACKSALAVGMRCCVVPDSFTQWQDFAGADLVAENISELKLDNILGLLTPAHFRERAK